MLAAFVCFEDSYSLPFSTILDMVQCWPIKEWHQNMSREFRSFHPTTNKKTKSVQINKADNYLSKSEIPSISIFFIVPQLPSYQKAKIYWGHAWNLTWSDICCLPPIIWCVSVCLESYYHWSSGSDRLRSGETTEPAFTCTVYRSLKYRNWIVLTIATSCKNKCKFRPFLC